MPRRAIPPHIRDASTQRSIAQLRAALARAVTDPHGAVVFDAYGTLFDLRSVEVACAAVTADATAFAAHWRAKQLEYSWQRTLMGRYADFAAVTAEALDHAIMRFGIAPDEATKRALLAAWLALEPFPDVREALDRLAPRPLAILSNGSPAMLDALLEHSALADQFAAVLSVDAAGAYKPDPRAYALAPVALGQPAERLLFVTANPWDAIGAKNCGFRVVWCNRAGLAFDTHGPAPDIEVRSLAELAEMLAR